MLFLRKRQKIYIKTKFSGWGVLFSRYCIQLQIEWYQPPIGIFLVCGEITKIISKMFQKIGKFHVIFEKTSKIVLKQNSQVGGSNLHKLHSFTNRMVPTPQFCYGLIRF